jgi:enoyl-CoA hydratase
VTYKEHYDGIDFAMKEHVVSLTFNNPSTLNSLSYDVFMSINEIFETMTNDDNVWGVIITGAGDKSFIAGADLSDKRMQGANFKGPVTLREVRRNIVHDSLRHILDFERPVIAAINGYCLGGGAELASCCDFRIASKKAKIGYPEVKLGGIPAYLGVTQAMRIMPPASAKEMLMTGIHYTADEALRLGFVSKVVEPDELIQAAEAFMADITKNAPLAIKYCKICADRCMEMSLNSSSEMECLIAAILATTEDGKEGKAAFHEKRQPVWAGR